MKRICGLLAGIAGLGMTVATAQTTGPTAPTTRQWTIEDFAALPLIERPMLSPDGLHIASRAAIGGEQKLVIADVHDGPNRVRTMGDNDLNWWQWVNDDWLIVGVGSETQVQGMPWYLSRVVSIKRDGSKINMLAKNVAAQNADDVIWVARDGTPRILLSYQTSIYSDDAGFWPKVDEVDVTTGRMRSAVAPKQFVRNWYADASGTVRMAWAIMIRLARRSFSTGRTRAPAFAWWTARIAGATNRWSCQCSSPPIRPTPSPATIMKGRTRSTIIISIRWSLARKSSMRPGSTWAGSRRMPPAPRSPASIMWPTRRRCTGSTPIWPRSRPISTRQWATGARASCPPAAMASA
ncbi:MAG: hypothetical protein U9R77_10425 [Pseudomonadota bacterium]|nr:hypothetical protein [Pseudomonadota bacterium]